MIGTRDELRRYLHTAGGGAEEDTLLDDLLAAASDRFKSLTPGRTLEPDPAPPAEGDPAPAPIVRTFRARGSVVRLPDLRVDSLSAVALDGAALDVAGLDLEGRDGEGTYLIARLPQAAPMPVDVLVPIGNTWTTAAGRYRRTVSISGYWGPAAPFPRVVEAVLIWAARVYHERAARWSDARQDPEGGVASYFRRIPPSIEAVVNDLRVPGL